MFRRVETVMVVSRFSDGDVYVVVGPESRSYFAGGRSG
jgi:hypothetical protein